MTFPRDFGIVGGSMDTALGTSQESDLALATKIVRRAQLSLPFGEKPIKRLLLLERGDLSDGQRCRIRGIAILDVPEDSGGETVFCFATDYDGSLDEIDSPNWAYSQFPK